MGEEPYVIIDRLYPHFMSSDKNMWGVSPENSPTFKTVDEAKRAIEKKEHSSFTANKNRFKVVTLEKAWALYMLQEAARGEAEFETDIYAGWDDITCETWEMGDG